MAKDGTTKKPYGIAAGPNTAPKGVGVKAPSGGLKSASTRAALYYARKRRIARITP